MTSPDGITWTIRTSSVDRQWQAVTYGNGTFVAVADSGTGNRVMTSPDGVTWTSRVSAGDHDWNSVTYGNGTFVAVSQTAGVGNQVMTSPDGITWTIQTSAADLFWQSVTYGNGLFVAVAYSGTGNRVMTSPDGVTWTSRTSAADLFWWSVTYGDGLFVAVANSGTGNRVMTSPDGITWTSRVNDVDNDYKSVTYDNGLFVAVSSTGTGDRVMTSGEFSFPVDRTVYIEAESSIDPDGIAPDSLLSEVRDNINYDPDTGLSRPPLGLTNSTLYVESITRIEFFIQLEGINVASDQLVDAKSDIEDALDLYFAEIAPFLDGVDVENEKNDTVTDLTLSDVIQDVLESYGGSAETVSFGLTAGTFDQGTYTLEPGELAKNGGVTYV
jgi:hypothetical protein